jgi:hypothetical protein
MNIGSSITLRIAAPIISLLGRRVSPVARMLAVPTMPSTMNGTALYRIIMKLWIIGSMSSGAPIARNNGLIVSIPAAATTPVIRKDRIMLSVARRFARG